MLDLYLTALAGAPLLSQTMSTRLVAFVKLYDPYKEELHYVGPLPPVPPSSRVADVMPEIRRLARLPEKRRVLLYEEVAFYPRLLVEEV